MGRKSMTKSSSRCLHDKHLALIESQGSPSSSELEHHPSREPLAAIDPVTSNARFNGPTKRVHNTYHIDHRNVKFINKT